MTGVMDRRAFLERAGAAVGLTVLAGCPGRTVRETPSRSPSPPLTDPPTETPTAPPTSTPTERTTTVSPTPAAADRPVFFSSPAKIAALRERIEAGDQPWKRAFDEMIEDADRALDVSPRSVVDNGTPAGADDPHRYGSDAPYQGKDGVFSDDINRKDYQAALEMKDWIRDTAQAYRFTGDDKYAEKSVDLLYAWFVDEETRMYPSVVNYGPHTEGLKGQNSIEHYIFVPAMVYGAALVSDHPYWHERIGSHETGVRAWLREFQQTLESGAHGGVESDEIHKWWVTTRLLVAAYLGDMDAFESACGDWRRRVVRDFAERGTFEKDRPRTRGLYYSLSAMNALTLGAEIARHHGVDLYGYAKEDMSVSVLQRSHRYHAEFLVNPEEWPWKERNGLDAGERRYGAVSYELCYSRWQNGRYWEAIKAAGRPVYDRRVLGYATLTHGDLFELEY
jgi:hypothetical protein